MPAPQAPPPVYTTVNLNKCESHDALTDIHLYNVLTKQVAEERAKEEQRVIMTNALKGEMEDEAEEKR